jgi:hypothetical protein
MIENPELVERLGLTEEQVSRLKNKGYELRREVVKLKAELELAAMEQARMLTAESVDKAALMAAVEKTGAIRTEIGKRRMLQVLLIKDTLNEDQLRQLREFRRWHARGDRSEAKERMGGEAERDGIRRRMRERGERVRRERGDRPRHDGGRRPRWDDEDDDEDDDDEDEEEDD